MAIPPTVKLVLVGPSRGGKTKLLEAYLAPSDGSEKASEISPLLGGWNEEEAEKISQAGKEEAQRLPRVGESSSAPLKKPVEPLEPAADSSQTAADDVSKKESPRKQGSDQNGKPPAKEEVEPIEVRKDNASLLPKEPKLEPLWRTHIATKLKCSSSSVFIKDRSVRIGYWDTGESVRTLVYPETDCFMLCMPFHDETGWDNLTKWMVEVCKVCPNTPVLVVGLQSDMRSDPALKAKLKAEGKKLPRAVQLLQMAMTAGGKNYVETSSTKGFGVDTAFNAAIKLGMEYSMQQAENPTPVPNLADMSLPDGVIPKTWSVYFSRPECSHCHNKVAVGAKRVHCFEEECKEPDMCEACYKEDNHPHRVYLEKVYLPADMSWRMSGLTPCETLSRSFYYFRERPALGERPRLPDGSLSTKFEWLTYGQLELSACLFACGLMSLGIKRRDFVGICSRNRTEHFIADLACVFYSLISVAVHTVLDAPSLTYVVNNAEFTAVVASTSTMPMYLDILDRTPSVKVLVLMGRDKYSEMEVRAAAKGVKFVYFDDVEELGKKNIKQKDTGDPSDLFSIYYTSGSTGTPKGVMKRNAAFNTSLVGAPFVYAILLI